jgi:hypothetical protein
MTELTSGETAARDAGFFDALTGQRLVRWTLLHLATPSDRELSYYWYGWHQGLKQVHSMKPRRK